MHEMSLDAACAVPELIAVIFPEQGSFVGPIPNTTLFIHQDVCSVEWVRIPTKRGSITRRSGEYDMSTNIPLWRVQGDMIGRVQGWELVSNRSNRRSRR